MLRMREGPLQQQPVALSDGSHFAYNGEIFGIKQAKRVEQGGDCSPQQQLLPHLLRDTEYLRQQIEAYSVLGSTTRSRTSDRDDTETDTDNNDELSKDEIESHE